MVEPNLAALPPPLASLPDVRLASSDEARGSADIVALLVEHRQFRRIEPDSFLSKAVVDATGLLSTRKVRALERP